MQHLLPSAQGLVREPTAADHKPAVVIHEQEEPGRLAARGSWEGH